MARTMSRGKRDKKTRDWDGKITGPRDNPEDGIESADERGEIKKGRPDKKWLRDNRAEEEE